MKKITLSLLSLGLVAFLGISVVSCAKPMYASGLEGQRVMVITDAGKIGDKSFNESAWNGMTSFTKETYNLDSSNNYIESSSGSEANLMSAYKLAIFKNADSLVMPGFSHAGTISKASKLAKNRTIVLADSPAPPELTNVISLIYNSELSGFAAGFDASVWATSIDPQTNKMRGDANGDGIISMGTFAGFTSKYSVDNYNWGFMVGMQTYNLLAINAKNPDGSNRAQVYFANKGTTATVDKIGVVHAGDANWFSNSFALGGGTQSGIVGKLYNNKADIIFTVAGPQIQDVLSFNGGYKPFVVGVDTDQVQAYESYKSRFLSSATKNLSKSIYDALKHAKSLQKKDGSYWEKQATIDDLQNGYWDGLNPPAQPDWSYNLTGGDNILQQSIADFENEGEAWTWLRKIVIDELANVGMQTEDYWNSTLIKNTAEKIVEANQDAQKKLDINIDLTVSKKQNKIKNF